MVHPQYWSLYSVFNKIRGLPHQGSSMTAEDAENYHPPFSLKGLTVLDVGAYVGDSALFFKGLGATKIICIEPFYADELRQNIKKFNIPAIVIEEKFCLRHLSIPHNFAKVDVEGYEEDMLILNPSELSPTVMEVHGQQLADKFVAKGWTLMHKRQYGGCVNYCNNYSVTFRPEGSRV